MMKFIIITFSLLFLFVGCSKRDDKTSDNKKADSIDSTSLKIEKQPGSSAKGKDEITGKEENKNKIFSKLSFNKNNIPSDCIFKGHIVDGAHWNDRNGENLLIITETDVKQVNQDIRNQYLYGYLFTKSNEKWDLTWSITDFIEGYCDAAAKYITGTLEVLDIDNDGIAENIFIYKLDERCDVSPLNIKLMMHSGDKKLVIRGDTRVDIGNGEKAGGKKTFDETFNSAPSSFKDYASKKWDNFMKENKNP